MYRYWAKQLWAILAIFCAGTAMGLAEAVVQPAESLTDRFIALGLAAGLLAFAFYKRKPLQTLPPLKAEETNPFLAQVETAHSEPARPAAVELAVAELAIVELAVAERAVEDASIDAHAVGRAIVVPVDFSPNSAFAIRLALLWSKPNDRVKVVYCIDLENSFPPASLTPSDLIAIHPAFAKMDQKTALQWSRLPWVVVEPLAMGIVERWAVNEFAKLNQSLPIANKIPVEFQVLHGNPVNQIAKLSETISAKLIVLVAHRHSVSDQWLNGSHADKLLHVSRIPIIALCEPTQPETSLPQEILITTDFSAESLQVFLVIADIIQGSNAIITVLTVETFFERHPKASEMLASLERELRCLGLELRNVKIKAANVETGILDYVKTHRPQLIAMSSHGRLGFSTLFHANVTKTILHEAGVPVLVVHGKSSPITKTVGNLAGLLPILTGLHKG